VSAHNTHKEGHTDIYRASTAFGLPLSQRKKGVSLYINSYYLKQAIDAVRKLGQLVFFEDDERLQGYFSQYYKKANKARNSPDEAQSETQTETAG
jgi:hypothetical protein